jgi:phospholipid transport system substrate-binding protein
MFSRSQRNVIGRALVGPLIAAIMVCATARFTAAESVADATTDEIAPAAAQTDPMEVVKAGINDVMAVYKDESITKAARREKLRAMAADYFDFAYMARSALGYHWRDLTPQQRDEFVPVFKSFIEVIYLSKLQEYSAQKVEQVAKTVNISFTRETFDGPEYAQVFSTVRLQNQKQPVAVNYLLSKNAQGRWRIYDITVDAISVMANYRNQFNRVINNDGYDKLVDDLKAKSHQLDATLGQ